MVGTQLRQLPVGAADGAGPEQGSTATTPSVRFRSTTRAGARLNNANWHPFDHRHQYQYTPASFISPFLLLHLRCPLQSSSERNILHIFTLHSSCREDSPISYIRKPLLLHKKCRLENHFPSGVLLLSVVFFIAAYRVALCQNGDEHGACLCLPTILVFVVPLFFLSFFS